MADNVDQQKQYNDELRESLRLRQLEIEEIQELRGAIQANIAELTKQDVFKQSALKSSRNLKSLSEDLLSDLRDEKELNEDQLENLNQKLSKQRNLLALDIEAKRLRGEDVGNFEEILNFSDQLITKAQERLELEKGIREAQGISGNLGKGLQGVLDKVGGGKLSKALGIDDAMLKNKKFTKSLLKDAAKNGGNIGKIAGQLGTKFKVALNLIGNLGKNLLKALGPITLIAELVMGIGRADKETTELGKSMALTKGEATVFRENLAEAARDSGNIAVTSEKVVKSFNELNKQLGFINNFTLDTLVTMTKLTEQVGLSAQEAGALVTLSEARGKNAEDEYKAILATTYNLQRQTGIQLDNREVLKTVAAVSGQLRANLEANPAAIAEAVTLAVQLGGSLDDVKNISSAILDFEASIAKELEAELLTGKEINLERARLAALNGDIADLTREISSQVGTFTEFSKMNVIQQEALAQAFGLSSDRLSDMLFKQQVMGRSAKELRALGEDELADRVEQLSLADKFNKTVEDLKSIFADVGQAFMPFLQLLGFALSIVGLIAGLITDILSMFMKLDFDFSATAASLNSLGSQLGFEGGGGGSGYNSDGRRPASSRNGSMASNNQPVNVNVNPNIYMDERKLSTGMSMNNYAVGS